MSEKNQRISAKFKMIPMEQLCVPNDLFEYKNPPIKQLQESIKTYGLLQPLIVTEPFKGKGVYRILDGCERYRAIENINKSSEGEFKELPCYVLEFPLIKNKKDMADVKNKLAMYEQLVKHKVTNNEKREYERFFDMYTLYIMAQKKIINQSQITSIFQIARGISERTARNYNIVWRDGIGELIKAVVSDGKDHIPIDLAAQVATLSEEEQKHIIDRANKEGHIRQILKEKRETMEN